MVIVVVIVVVVIIIIIIIIIIIVIAAVIYDFVPHSVVTFKTKITSNIKQKIAYCSFNDCMYLL